MPSEVEKEVYRARHTLPSTGMTTGQVLEDLALLGQDLWPPFTFLILWENSAKAGPRVWMDQNARATPEVKVRRSRLAS